MNTPLPPRASSPQPFRSASTVTDVPPAPAERTVPDSELLARWAAGGPEASPALTELVARHDAHMKATAARVVYRRDQVDDAVQNAWIRVMRAAAGFRGDAAVSTWLHRIAVNEALDLARPRSSRELPAGDLEIDRPGRRQNVPDFTEAAVTRDVVQQAVASLPEVHRVVLTLVDLQGLSDREAAERLAIPAGTVRTRRLRARATLAHRLASLHPDCR